MRKILYLIINSLAIIGAVTACAAGAAAPTTVTRTQAPLTVMITETQQPESAMPLECADALEKAQRWIANQIDINGMWSDFTGILNEDGTAGNALQSL